MVKKIKELCKKINKSKFNSSILIGFKFPNDFSIFNLLQICSKDIKFNKFLCDELCFAINESEAKNINKLSFYNKIFLIYILFKCNEKYECWFSEEFYLLILDIIINSNKNELHIIFEVLDDINIEFKETLSLFNFILITLKIYILYKIDEKDRFENLQNMFNSLKKIEIDDFENEDIKKEFFEILISNCKNNLLKNKIIQIYKNKFI